MSCGSHAAVAAPLNARSETQRNLCLGILPSPRLPVSRLLELINLFGVAGAEAQAAEHGFALAMLVGVVAGFAGLVVRFALGIQHLKLAQHVHDWTQVFRARPGQTPSGAAGPVPGTSVTN